MLKGCWTNVTPVPERGNPPIIYGWYTSFAPLVAIAELVVAIALVVGMLTGVAAFFGALMNFDHMLVHACRQRLDQPAALPAGVLLIRARKTAGWSGLGCWVLPALGTPWEPGPLVHHEGAVDPSGRGRAPPAVA